MRCNNILDAIGHTPLVRLNRLTQGFSADVYVKADYMNPGGSVKDRIGVSIIDEAERKGLLKPGGTIIEGTSGNTGIGLALVGAVRGYKLVFTITDKQSKEKVDLLKALGAEVIVCPTAVEPDDPRSYYSVAKKLAQDIPNSFYPNQYENPMNPEAHYRTTGPEIWEDSEGKITHFICGMGTGGTISGAGRYLKEKNPNVKIIGVDPIGSLYYEFAKTGKVGKAKTYVVEGIGEDIFPPTMNFEILDDVVQVNDQECFVWARRLVKQEGIFTGGSGGGCISATLRVAKALPKGSFVVAFLPDTGMRYLSKVYSDEWMRERGYTDSEVPLTAEDVVNAKRKTGKVRELIVAGPDHTVFHALHTMQTQDISQLPVFEGKAPVGAIYEDQILNLALQGKDLRKMVIREVMSEPLPLVPCEAPVERLTYLLSHEEPAVFVQMGNGRFEIITKYDLMGTIAGLMEQKRSYTVRNLTFLQAPVDVDYPWLGSKKKKRIAHSTPSDERRVKTEGLWTKCESCRTTVWKKDLEANWRVCPKCQHHFRLSATQRLELLLDSRWVEYDAALASSDPLHFTDTRPYAARLKDARKKLGMADAIITVEGLLGGRPVICCSMEFGFIGGSMGAVVGEKVTRAIEMSIDKKIPLVIVSCSGGARMMEGTISLMQLAKVSAALARLDEVHLPFISVLTDPTTGGVTASYAMLGDINIAEPGALIGFAGPRVIEQTIRQKLPEGFQTSEFLLEHGFLDAVVHRKELKTYISSALEFFLA